MKFNGLKNSIVVILSAMAGIYTTGCSDNEIKEMQVCASQTGYAQNGVKSALVRNINSETFTVRDSETDEVVFTGVFNGSEYWDKSGDTIRRADFSSLQPLGNYYIECGGVKSRPFSITKDGEVNEMCFWVHKAFYMWRATEPIEEQYATRNGISYARQAGPNGKVVVVHESAESESRKTGDTIEVDGGWFDAGDYGVYTVNGAFAVLTLLNGYESYKEYYDTLSLNIPKKEGLPDILTECDVQLKWLMKMMDPSDKTVAHKVTPLRFDPMVMPADVEQPRYLIGKSTSDNLMFAAAMSKASRIYNKFENQKANADSMLTAAIDAYSWAEKNPDIMFKNPDSINTGEYGMKTLSDNWLLASTELYLTTGEDKYLNKMVSIGDTCKFDIPSWEDVNTLALISMILSEKTGAKGKSPDWAKKKLTETADIICKRMFEHPSRIPFAKFEWGSNGQMACAGVVLAAAYSLSENQLYLQGMREIVTYLTGANSTDYCFISGFGQNYPIHIHDRRCEADGIKEPLPGLVVGGPNIDATYDLSVYSYYEKDENGNPILGEDYKSYPTTTFVARCYADNLASFSTNEVAINWNAPLAVLLAAVSDAVNKGR